jgi:ligand-binding sensor domain-containing protein/serine phosphatase RsbU (regulator of sigma subunit)
MLSGIRHIKLSALACLLLLCETLTGQAYRFRDYGQENNLPSEVIYTLNQDKSGYLWVGTTEGLSRFDGFDFFRVEFPDSVTGRYPTVSIKDSNGNLWFGCNDGTVFYADGTELKKADLPESSGTGISSILESPDGELYIIPQRKPLFRINRDKPSVADIVAFGSDVNMSSACMASSGLILIGTQENLMICKPMQDSLSIQDIAEGFDYSRIVSINQLNSRNEFIVGTDGNGLFRLIINDDETHLLSRFERFPELDNLEIKSIIRDSENDYWACASGTGLLLMEFSDRSDSLLSVKILDTSSGLMGLNLSTVFQDSEGHIWIGFNGEGLSMLNKDSFEFDLPGTNGNPNDIIFTGKLKGDYILGTPSGFYIYDLSKRKSKRFVPFTMKNSRNEISSYYIDNDNNIWIGTRGAGLFSGGIDGKFKQFYKSGDSGEDYINNIEIKGDRIWLATLNGVNIVSRTTGNLLKSYDINNGLPHNSINQVFLGKDGGGYVATESDHLFKIIPDSGITASDNVMYGMLLNKILAITEDKSGNIWVATYGNGVFEFKGDSVRSFTTADGLLSNYIHSIFASDDDKIWIGFERGFAVYDQGTGLIKVYGTEFAKGGSCNSGGIYESPDGKILIGTTEGLIVYDGSKDKIIKQAPVNNINSVSVNGVIYPYRPVYSFPYKKRYTIKINYAGIDFTSPEKVYYSTMLENYDDEWTGETSSREVTYNLSYGKYKFNLLSVNEDGLTQENPLSFEINIKRPVWQSWWFILTMLAAITGVVIIIIREREKAQKKIQEYLEKELEARTRVVMKQKAEIEHQNLEITDSINYARRIQSSILPDINRLKEHFEGAFILLYPRDIVSGDFYWFDKLDDDRFILVCADSTGHGVPGAFMSMIGSTLLQDIVSRQGISKPSEILTMLDKQIFSTLNQNVEVGVSNDGMDVVVCEFSMKNRHVRFASAMRPVIMVIGGETYYLKGNRASVGGQTVIEKYFDDQEYYLNEGDSIYMFSDGLPDQFGGPEGKKMKIARLKNFISEVHSMPLEHQELEFARLYREWRGNLDQVDDILLMGVKV